MTKPSSRTRVEGSGTRLTRHHRGWRSHDSPTSPGQSSLRNDNTRMGEGVQQLGVASGIEAKARMSENRIIAGRGAAAHRGTRKPFGWSLFRCGRWERKRGPASSRPVAHRERANAARIWRHAGEAGGDCPISFIDVEAGTYWSCRGPTMFTTSPNPVRTRRGVALWAPTVPTSRGIGMTSPSGMTIEPIGNLTGQPGNQGNCP